MKNRVSILILGVMIMLLACSDSEDPAPAFETTLDEITTHTENGITVTLFANEKFFVGYNAITAKIEDQNGNLLSGDVEVTPMMDMMSMQHSCPTELVDGNKAVNGSFAFNTAFVMPSGDMGSWSINFTVNGTAVKVPVEVSQPQYARLVSFVSAMDETTKYFVTLVQPGDPKVGQNDLELAIFKKQA